MASVRICFHTIAFRTEQGRGRFQASFQQEALLRCGLRFAGSFEPHSNFWDGAAQSTLPNQPITRDQIAHVRGWLSRRHEVLEPSIFVG